MKTLLFLFTLLCVLWNCSFAQSLEKHPVLRSTFQGKSVIDENEIELIMSMNFEVLSSFIPDKPVTAYCECPNCYSGVEGNDIFSWTPNAPNQMICKYCKTIFPNDKFPESWKIKGKNEFGTDVEYNYYYNSKNGVTHFLTNSLMRLKREWLEKNCLKLALAYQSTKNEKYAERVLSILHRVADVYPFYPVVRNYPRVFSFWNPHSVPYPGDAGRWGYFYNELSKELIRAYDCIYDSKLFDSLSAQAGYDIRKTIEDNYFKKCFQFIKNRGDVYASNYIGYDIVGAAMLGWVIGEPSYVHWSVRWMQKTLDDGFFADGMWRESPSYHYMTVTGLSSAVHNIKGYSDPIGYIDPIGNNRFDNLKLEQIFPYWSMRSNAPSAIVFPNGCTPSVGDTHPYEVRGPVKTSSASVILPFYGHAVLGHGNGKHQLQAHLHFGGNYGHAHLDKLNFNLWAKEHELFSDIGYTWTQMRHWTTSTFGHNTVVIDKKNQIADKKSANVLYFFPNNNSISFVAADARNVYSSINNLTMYNRQIVLVPVSSNDAYIVDIFRIQGGTVHDWTINGDADKNMKVLTDLHLKNTQPWMLEPGQEWIEPSTKTSTYNPYGMMRDVAYGAASKNFSVKFYYTDDSAYGINEHFLSDTPGDLFIGKSPSVRGMGQGVKGDMNKSYEYWMPKIVLRKTGQSPLKSVFTVVHEPYHGNHYIAKTEKLDYYPRNADGVVIAISYGDTVDIVISDPLYENTGEKATLHNIKFHCSLGIVRQVKNKTTHMWMFDGKSLSDQYHTLTSSGKFSGKIIRTLRKDQGDSINAFITADNIDQQIQLTGHWMVVTLSTGVTLTIEIERVYKYRDISIIKTASDHGLSILKEVASEIFFPKRVFHGETAFVVPLQSHLVMNQK